MARILILAKSGFGKTSGIGKNTVLGFEGLNVATTYVVSVTTKPLTFKGSPAQYPVTGILESGKGRRVIAKTPEDVAYILELLANPAIPITDVIWDDANYTMQDWYMKNAKRTGWDAPKEIGMKMGYIFDAIEKYMVPTKNIFVLAHGENIEQPDGRIYTKMKTTGKMVDEYLTPEGKFDVVLVGKSTWDATQKKMIKVYVTSEDETYASPKSPMGMFDSMYISNDLGPIARAVTAFYNDADN